MAKFDLEKVSKNEEIRIGMIAKVCRTLYNEIMCLPDSMERSIAITKLEEVSMWANYAVIRNGANLPCSCYTGDAHRLHGVVYGN